MIVIEDGSLTEPNANSYIDEDTLRTYAALRGVDLYDLSDAEVAVALIKAMDYTESLRDRYDGERTSPMQPLQWPRSGVMINNLQWDENEIPRELIYAQCALSMESMNFDLQPNPSDKGSVIREKVGGLEVVYAEKARTSPIAAFSKPESLLQVLFKNRGLSFVRT